MTTLDFDKATAIRAAVDVALKTVFPERHTTELAAEIAEDVITRLRQPATGPLTTAQRGPEWMLRWNCPPWCIKDHAAPNEGEWHSTAPVETELRDLDMDSSGYSANGGSLPWLGARIVVSNDKPQAYGRETRVWVDYGVHTGELSPVKAREALEAMRWFVGELEAVIERAEEIAADDFKGDPEIARLDREAEDARIRAITEEHE